MTKRVAGEPKRRPWRWLIAAGLSLITALLVHMPKGIWQLLVLLGAALVWFLAAWLLPKRAFNRFLLVLGCCAALLALFFGAMIGSASRLDVHIPAVTREAYVGKNVLLIVPHQDDDVSTLGGVIEAYAEASDVHIAFVTTGDNGGSPTVRMREAAAAAAAMGVSADSLILLGYGNDWDTAYGHMYHAPDDEPLLSAAGFKETYGTPEYPPFREKPYTRGNVLDDLEALILTLRPDTIFCIDYDGHPDHRAVSMLFEEAMGRILKRESGYAPAVYKGFSYSTSFNALKDFYALNLLSTRSPSGTDNMYETRMYRWSQRVRFVMADRAVSRFLRYSSTMHALEAYRSQDSAYYREQVVNGDRVLWQRDTGGLLYAAEAWASSGNAAALNDFCMQGSENVMDVYRPPYDGLWSPDAEDGEKRAVLTFPAPVMLDELRFYDNPTAEDNILALNVLLDDGTLIACGPLEPDGAATVLRFEERPVKSLSVELLALEGERPGLAEMEAYDRHAAEGARWIKLTDEADNFVYDYIVPRDGSISLGLYESPAAAGEGAPLARYAVQTEGEGCRAVPDGERIEVYCPRGQSCVLTLRALDDPLLMDAVRLENPNALRRGLIQCAQWAERVRPSLTWRNQKLYYGGIFTRLLGRSFL